MANRFHLLTFWPFNGETIERRRFAGGARRPFRWGIWLTAFLLSVSWVGGLLSQEISRDVVSSGVVHRSFYFKDVPWAIEVLQVDLTNPSVFLETVKAQNRLRGYERTSQMARRKDQKGHRVVGAVNGDFYGRDGIPVNCQVRGGLLLKEPAPFSVFGVLEGKRPFIARLRYKGTILSPRKAQHRIHGINRERRTDELILYNPYFGPSTETNVWGAEVTFLLVDDWAVNDTFKVVAVAVDSVRGNRSIPKKGGVLSGHGKARRWLLKEVKKGDTLRVVLQLWPLKGKVLEALGGIPRIVRDGKISIEEDRKETAFAQTRHPRTAAGFSADSTTLYLVTVDGRQPGYSVGMTLEELAQFMIRLGCAQAINLDGGGSTTMVVRHRVVNRPSDSAGERSVSNALLVVTAAPEDSLPGVPSPKP